MSSSFDFSIRISIEFFKCFSNFQFNSIWRSITNNMKNSSSDLRILVISHFKDSLPELGVIFLDFTRTKLSNSLQTNFTILVICIFKNLIDAFSFVDSSKNLLFLAFLLTFECHFIRYFYVFFWDLFCLF